MEKLTQDSPVRALPGIGDSRAAAFARMGVHTLRDLLYHFPRAYETRGNVRRLCDGVDGERSAFLLTVGCEPRTALIRRGMSLTKFRAFDESGTVEVVFFNQTYVRDIFHTGACFRFFGKLTRSRTGIQLASPAFEPLVPGQSLPDLVARYPLTEGLSGKVIEKAVQAALRACLPTLSDPLPSDLRERYCFPSLSHALMTLHAPQSEEQLRRALDRLVYEELLCLSLGLSLSRDDRSAALGIPCPPCDLSPLLNALPYRLTDAQMRVCREIRADMARPDHTPMHRILVGDVGSGKTICAAIAIYTAIRAGGQAALMVPTEILARQHYTDLASLLAPAGIRIACLTGATPEKEKKDIRTRCAAIGADRIDLLIGTHALLQDKIQFSRLYLTVTDEQHRFGVRQRAALQQKRSAAHLLVMSATPIPRTLALALYGDLDISRLDEMPPGRQRVDTFVVNESYRERLNGFIRREVQGGGQVYIVCPAVEDADSPAPEDMPDGQDLLLTDIAAPTQREASPPLRSAVNYAAQLQRETFPDLRIAFLHGRMKAAEKDAVMQRFSQGEIDILVSTTVIEVGVNVPRATLMIVENAERFGLSQLHQLRGRVGRGQKKSYCILLSDSQSESARQRLQTMHTTYDGFTIAEKDLRQRGPGDFLSATCGGTWRQSGGLSLPLLSLCHDTTLLTRAGEDARQLLCTDPALQSPTHAPLRAALERLFSLQEAALS